jgi:hypothetical protein
VFAANWLEDAKGGDARKSLNGLSGLDDAGDIATKPGLFDPSVTFSECLSSYVPFLWVVNQFDRSE